MIIKDATKFEKIYRLLVNKVSSIKFLNITL